MVGMKTMGTSVIPFWKDVSAGHKKDANDGSHGGGGSTTNGVGSTGEDMDHFKEAPTIT